jgi:hypothetical protein
MEEIVKKNHIAKVKETYAMLTEEELMLLELLEKQRITSYQGKKSVTAKVNETYAMLTEDERMLLELLEKKQRITSYQIKKSVTGYASNSSPEDNTAIYADATKGTHDMCALITLLFMFSEDKNSRFAYITGIIQK